LALLLTFYLTQRRRDAETPGNFESSQLCVFALKMDALISVRCCTLPGLLLQFSLALRFSAVLHVRRRCGAALAAFPRAGEAAEAAEVGW